MSDQSLVEEDFAALRGRTFDRVRYFGAWANSPWEAGAYVEWIELHTSSDDWFRITTELEFGDHGICLFDGPVPPGTPCQVLEATSLPPWAGVIGRTLQSAKVLWWPLQGVGGASQGTQSTFPRDVVWTFADGRRLVISAAGVDEVGALVLGVDSVMALSEAQGRELGLL